MPLTDRQHEAVTALRANDMPYSADGARRMWSRNLKYPVDPILPERIKRLVKSGNADVKGKSCRT